MAASASFNLEDGIRTWSCMATLALRIRVSMSAMGSVMVIRCRPLPSPAGLGHARQLAGVGQNSNADAAEPELAVHRARPAAPPATGVGAHLELGLALLLFNQCFLCHQLCCPSRRNGNPKASSRALPSSLVRAVVTIVMSIPRGVSTLS